LGIEEGGIHSAEALLLARYFMFSQVYIHHIRRIYDIHLKDFLKEWLKNGMFSTRINDHLSMTDNEISSAITRVSLNKKAKGHDPASRLTEREHFKLFYQPSPEEKKINPEAGQAVFEAAIKEFGAENVRYDSFTDKDQTSDFPVLRQNGEVVSSMSVSDVLRSLPILTVQSVYINPRLRENAKEWLTRSGRGFIQ